MASPNGHLARQALKVLAALEAAGTRGVHSHELRSQHFVGNPSQRIAELEAAGHVIAHKREVSPYGTDSWGSRYVLQRGPEHRITAQAPAQLAA